MIGWIAKKLLLAKVPESVARPIAWAVIVVALGLAIWLALEARDRETIANHETKIEAEVERGGRAADTAAALRAEARRKAEKESRNEFDAATAHLPDEGLTDRQRLDLCNELRQAGTDTALIPECRLVRPGGEASARRGDPPARQPGGLSPAPAQQR